LINTFVFEEKRHFSPKKIIRLTQDVIFQTTLPFFVGGQKGGGHPERRLVLDASLGLG
jgi:hypothetical protein